MKLLRSRASSLLLTRMLNQPEDWHEIYEQIRFKLNELKAYGMPLPQDLVEFERDLQAEFEAREEGGRRRARMDKVLAYRTRR